MIQRQPITIQPQPQSSMKNNIPPGLECLVNTNQIFVKQKVELFEAFTGFETQNKYQIFDNAGQSIFFAKEDTDCCTRSCCGQRRPFDMTIHDRSGIEVIHLYRPFACQGCCYPCCLQSILIHAPPGNIVGTVEEEWSFMTPRLVVKDASGNVIFRIKGPCCPVACGGDVEFHVFSADGVTVVGKIAKKWAGLAQELFTDADNFGINFPMDLDVKMKAVMIGACILIDFMFFEKTK